MVTSYVPHLPCLIQRKELTGGVFGPVTAFEGVTFGQRGPFPPPIRALFVGPLWDLQRVLCTCGALRTVWSGQSGQGQGFGCRRRRWKRRGELLSSTRRRSTARGQGGRAASSESFSNSSEIDLDLELREERIRRGGHLPEIEVRPRDRGKFLAQS